MDKKVFLTQHIFNIAVALILQWVIEGLAGFFVAIGLIMISYSIYGGSDK